MEKQKGKRYDVKFAVLSLESYIVTNSFVGFGIQRCCDTNEDPSVFSCKVNAILYYLDLLSSNCIRFVRVLLMSELAI